MTNKYNVKPDGNFYYISRNDKKLTDSFDSYHLDDLTVVAKELNLLSDELADINKVCDEYRINYEDVAETLVEYILVDNEVIDTVKQIKELTKHNNELFSKGKSYLKNLDNLEKAILEVSEKYKDNDDVRTAINEITELKKEMDSHEKEKKKNL